MPLLPYHLFLLSPPCQLEAVPDPARSVTIQTLKTNQGTKFGTLEKPMFSLFEVISFWKKKKKKKKQEQNKNKNQKKQYIYVYL